MAHCNFHIMRIVEYLWSMLKATSPRVFTKQFEWTWNQILRPYSTMVALIIYTVIHLCSGWTEFGPNLLDWWYLFLKNFPGEDPWNHLTAEGHPLVPQKLMFSSKLLLQRRPRFITAATVWVYNGINSLGFLIGMSAVYRLIKIVSSLNFDKDTFT